MELRERVAQEFERRFGSPPSAVVRAPGRVNLIGEHTDYNDGFVLPMAIDRAVWIALQPAAGEVVSVASLDMGEERSFSLLQLRQAGDEGWLEYVKGTAWALQQAGHRLLPWEGVMAGDVPIGAGLSSSAALELATARAFAHTASLPWDPAAMARVGQRAENQWVGVNCGIMDQMISAAGRQDHALLLDCRTLEFELTPLPATTAVVVLDTGTRRGLVDSAYNERRAQCEAAAQSFGVQALRDVTAQEFAQRSHELDPTTARRARHVITENERTVAAARAMARGDAARMGQLMDASHVSLRDDFQVSSPALDAMVEQARVQAGCLGARMTGAGFGGCAVALVLSAQAAAFAADVAAGYRAETGHEPAVYVCRATDGAVVLPAGAGE
jgi:galactokinase